MITVAAATAGWGGGVKIVAYARGLKGLRSGGRF